MKRLLLLVCSLAFSYGYTQTCSIRCKASHIQEFGNFEEEMAVFYSIEFSLNGVLIKTTEKDEKTIPVNQNGFDTIRYSYIWNGEKIDAFSLCKFRANEHYTISPCTCCGIFLITPEKKPERGFVQFINESNSTYLGSASEIETDSIPPNSKTPFQFASISMNCGFRPSQIAVFEPGYFDPKYDYQITSKLPDDKKAELEAEQNKFIQYTMDFLFLHGERLILTIDKASQFTLKLE
jgi:hypothetical protein